VIGVCCTGSNLVQYSSTTRNVDSDSNGLYPGHIPTSLFQKILLSVGSSAMAITCPWRGGMYCDTVIPSD